MVLINFEGKEDGTPWTRGQIIQLKYAAADFPNEYWPAIQVYSGMTMSPQFK